jgi:hypothetical protein
MPNFGIEGETMNGTEEHQHEEHQHKEHQHKEHQHKEHSLSLTLWQKGLLYVLYGLIILMIIFSLIAMGNRGQEGYDKCIQKKCELKSQEFCSKPREISNCCEGAGGQLGQMNGEWKCVFR